MRKDFFISFLVVAMLMGCAGSGKHVSFAPSLSKGLDKAAAADKHTIIEFTSPT